ncbi:hypothetical protein LTR36_008815 [Oleoguttula mirabilis]|uniref:Uncharacterized protein n=1 Tax=Oleoguttula mirabilis TaxID=1507867 RepID=A0AAV9J903_9PEZI|nr:hypothetical protein LTR36_008815 [Oleoguttula mirabilis]
MFDGRFGLEYNGVTNDDPGMDMGRHAAASDHDVRKKEPVAVGGVEEDHETRAGKGNISRGTVGTVVVKRSREDIIVLPKDSVPQDSKDGLPPDVPANVAKLIADIKAVKRNSQDLPFRKRFREDQGFLGHFGRANGKLKKDSPLMEWDGDTRILATKWWEYLKGAV